MKVALFGAGRIGKVHAASIRMDPRSELVAVTDVVTEAAEALAKEHGIAVRSADDILADDGIDAILIASSTNTHPDLIEAGVEAGKASFCEKPIDLSLDRAIEVREIAAGHDKPMMMGFNRRFDPDFAALKAALDVGEIGTGELLSVTSNDPAPPPVSYIKVSGGLFRDMMIHDFDMCAFLFGMPRSVMAHGVCLADPEIGAAGDIDTAVVVLLASGREAAEVGNRLGVARLNLHGTGLGDGGRLKLAEVATPLGWVKAQDTLNRICDLGEQLGVVFTLENLNLPVDDAGVPFARAEGTLALVSAVNMSQLRLNLCPDRRGEPDRAMPRLPALDRRNPDRGRARQIRVRHRVCARWAMTALSAQRPGRRKTPRPRSKHSA